MAWTSPAGARARLRKTCIDWHKGIARTLPDMSGVLQG
jgi:nitrate/TMAO reductase-like tetraheme cytochrome c subunit